MFVPSLGWDTHVRFHRACDPLRHSVDAALSAEVCGYRAGAVSSPGYQQEYERFRAFLTAGIDEHSWTAATDVQRFFASVTLPVLTRTIERFANPTQLAPLLGVIRQFQCAGLPVLPAGYADARLLGNALLVPADACVDVPFTRWVDDYRLFANSQKDLMTALRRLEDELRALGLRTNPDKLQLLQRDAARQQILGVDLASVYHPESESPTTTRAALRRVFFEAATDPLRNRRLIRFCLPRLAEQHDPCALEYAFASLENTPWDAPRLAHYLAQFREDPRVAGQLAVALERAASHDDHWMLARLAPACAGLSLEEPTATALRGYAARTDNATVWGHALRLLSLSGDTSALSLATRGLDVRAALACYRDLEASPPTDLIEMAETTAMVLEASPAPAPSTASLL
jgi:hypothetical protein